MTAKQRKENKGVLHKHTHTHTYTHTYTHTHTHNPFSFINKTEKSKFSNPTTSTIRS